MERLSNQNSPSEDMHMLICTAGPEPAERMKAELVKMAEFFEAEITVLKVLPHGSAIPTSELLRKGEEAVRIIANALREHGIEADSHLRFSEDTTRAIIEISEELCTDVIIMGVGEKPSWLRKFVKGDVTEEVIHRASCPVVALPRDIERSPFDARS